MVEATTEKKPEQQPEEKEAVKAESTEKTPEEPAKEMRSVVLTSFGGLKSVKILKKPEPTLGPDDVIIRVKAW